MAKLFDLLESWPEMEGIGRDTRVPVSPDLSGVIHHRHEEGVGLDYFVSGCHGCRTRLTIIQACWREGLTVKFDYTGAENDVPVSGGGRTV